jgi:hypothetical protein
VKDERVLLEYTHLRGQRCSQQRGYQQANCSADASNTGMNQHPRA